MPGGKRHRDRDRKPAAEVKTLPFWGRQITRFAGLYFYAPWNSSTETKSPPTSSRNSKPRSPRSRAASLASPRARGRRPGLSLLREKEGENRGRDRPRRPHHPPARRHQPGRALRADRPAQCRSHVDGILVQSPCPSTSTRCRFPSRRPAKDVDGSTRSIWAKSRRRMTPASSLHARRHHGAPRPQRRGPQGQARGRARPLPHRRQARRPARPAKESRRQRHRHHLPLRHRQSARHHPPGRCAHRGDRPPEFVTADMVKPGASSSTWASIACPTRRRRPATA
jgi:hypothetical protein